MLLLDALFVMFLLVADTNFFEDVIFGEYGS
jgi:hypothetical protein